MLQKKYKYFSDECPECRSKGNVFIEEEKYAQWEFEQKYGHEFTEKENYLFDNGYYCINSDYYRNDRALVDQAIDSCARFLANGGAPYYAQLYASSEIMHAAEMKSKTLKKTKYDVNAQYNPFVESKCSLDFVIKNRMKIKDAERNINRICPTPIIVKSNAEKKIDIIKKVLIKIGLILIGIKIFTIFIPINWVTFVIIAVAFSLYHCFIRKPTKYY